MLRAVRGAIQVDSDSEEAIGLGTVALLSEIFERNGLEHEDLVSIFFTSTADLVADFPATSARTLGLGDVPLLCAQELSITGSMPRVIRVMVHALVDRPKEEIVHVYLGGAAALRRDLAQ